jgi:voltage-gated potassium channel
VRAVGICTVLSLLAVSIVGNSLMYWYFDGPVKAEQGTTLTLSDAVWYSVISITTIGYGDNYAESAGARWGTVIFVVILGLATFSVIVGMAIDTITNLAMKAHTGMGEIVAKDHTLIVNYPSTSQVRQLIEELKADPNYDEGEIVIVSDSLESLPFKEDNVLFIRGPLLEEETYQRAKVADAKLAIVLATSASDPNSDAVVASIIAVIERANSALHTVAECLNYKHKVLFDSVNCDAIVCSTKISGNLLSQEAHDAGVSRLIDSLTSNVTGNTLFAAEVAEDRADLCYRDLAKQLLDHDINLLCVNRGEESITSFVDVKPVSGDRAIYAATRRLPWAKLLQECGV